LERRETKSWLLKSARAAMLHADVDGLASTSQLWQHGEGRKGRRRLRWLRVARWVKWLTWHWHNLYIPSMQQEAATTLVLSYLQQKGNSKSNNNNNAYSHTTEVYLYEWLATDRTVVNASERVVLQLQLQFQELFISELLLLLLRLLLSVAFVYLLVLGVILCVCVSCRCMWVAWFMPVCLFVAGKYK